LEKTPSIYVALSCRECFGKTALCIGLSLIFKENGLKVGYFKPLGWGDFNYKGLKTDEDAALMKETLGLKEGVQTIAPILLNYHYLEKLSLMDREVLLETIEESYRKVSEDKDIVLIEALHEVCRGGFMNLSVPEIARELGSRILLVSSVQRDYMVDEILLEKTRIVESGIGFLGLVMNNVSVAAMDRVRRLYIPILERSGVRTWGVIPETPEMSSPTGLEVKEQLRAEVLTREDRLEEVLVENYLVGAMTPDSALRYFRAAPRKAVITGGDRPDICLVALETDTSLLILTGNLRPSPVVLNRARERGVPVLLVPYDTYTTVNMLRDIAGKIKFGDLKRIRLAKELIAKNVDWRGMLKELGVW